MFQECTWPVSVCYSSTSFALCISVHSSLFLTSVGFCTLGYFETGMGLFGWWFFFFTIKHNLPFRAFILNFVR